MTLTTVQLAVLRRSVIATVVFVVGSCRKVSLVTKSSHGIYRIMVPPKQSDKKSGTGIPWIIIYIELNYSN